MSNPYEESSRLKKAVALADYLADNQCSEEMARIMTGDQWRAIAKRAGVNPPNSQETKALIYERLRRVRGVTA
jgi:hypothetical protein